MDIKKRKLKGYVALSVLIIVCMLLASAMTFFAPNKNAEAVDVTSKTASVLNLTASGGLSDNFSNCITGEQNEYIYFGSRSNSAVKWRVLSKADSKYSNGKMLLWSDSQLGNSTFNVYYQNPDYAYWGTSLLRATLNGGTYYRGSSSSADPTNAITVAESSSYLTMFEEIERANIVDTISYATKLYAELPPNSVYITTDIVANTDESGKYNSTRISNKSAHPAAADANVVGTSVVESSSGDTLFILDYYDLNNSDYGFDKDGGVVYANKIFPSWTKDSDGFPSYADNPNIASSCLASSGSSTYFWVRSAGRRTTSQSVGLLAGAGYVCSNYVTISNGVRPAFNFNPSNVIYATSASVASNGSTFAPVDKIVSSDGKPAYKVYMKTKDYINYNSSSSGAPKISVAKQTVTVTKSGQAGSAIILLADKTGNGEVKYQATTSFSGGVATANLPSGVNASEYSITVLFANSLRGGQYAESITGSYTGSVMAVLPKSIAPVDYNGEIQTLETLKEDEDWYNTAFEDASAVSVEYLTESGSPMGSEYPKNKGKYKIKFTILQTDVYSWSDAKSADDIERIIDFEIAQASLSVDFKVDKTKSPPEVSAKPTNLCESDSELADNILRIHYTGTYGNNIKYDEYNIAPSMVGNYTATVEINPKEDEYGNYKLNKTYSEPILINPHVVATPEVKPETGDSWYAYNGKNQYYIVSKYDSEFMEVKVADSYKGKFDIVGDTITVKNAGEYKNALIVTLKNAYDKDTGEGLNVWNATSKDSQPKTLSFTVDKDKIKVDVYVASEKSSSVINGIIGNSTLDVMVELNKKPADDLALTLNAKLIDGSSQPVDLTNFTVVNSLTMKTSLNISSFNTVRTYSIDVEVDSDNYEVEMLRPIKLSMTRVDNPNLVWLIRDTDGFPHEQEVDPSNKDVEYDETKFVYDGKPYTIEVNAPSGYKVQGSIVTVLEDTTTQLSEIKNAGTYISKVKLVKDVTSQETEYTIKWTIDKAKFDLTNVKWEHDGKIPFSANPSDMSAKIDASTLPKGLAVDEYIGVTRGQHADDTDIATVKFKYDTSDPSYALNYELPEQDGKDTNYTFNGTGDFAWDMTWKIEKLVIKVEWTSENYNNKYNRQTLKEDKNVVKYEYYLWDTTNKTIIEPALSEEQIEIVENESKYYVTRAIIKEIYSDDVEFDKSDEYILSPPFVVGETATAVNVDLASKELTYNGSEQQVKLSIDAALSENDFEITYFDKNGTTPLSSAPTNVGDYRVEIKLKDSVSGFYLAGDNASSDGVVVIEYTIKKMQVHNDEWNTLHNPPSLKVTAKEMKGIKHEYADMNGNMLQFSDLKAGNTYKVRAVIADKNNYVFADDTTETEWQEFTVSANEQLYDPDDPNNPFYPGEGNENPNPPTDNEDGNFNFDKVTEAIKQWWQVIASAISIILIVAFTAKGLDYASKKKENKRLIDSKYSAYAVGLFGITMTNWTIIACILMGVAVLSFIFMLLEKSGYKKSLRALEDAKEEYARNKEENMYMRMMGQGSMNGVMGGQGYGYAQPQFALEDMRGMINEAMLNMLPNVTQYLPQQASSNDELVQQLIEQNERNEERIDQLMQQLAEQKSVERVVEREVAASTVSDEVLERLAIKLQPVARDEKILQVVEKTEHNDEVIKQLLKAQEELMRNQDKLMEKIVELSNNKPAEPQVVVKEVPVEKIVEKKVEVPVEVEKIVEKEVIKEVPVPMPVEKPEPKAKKVPAPRLTLDEAYAKLSATQKKIFDTLKAYALTKNKCKEKKSTYFIVLGQSTVNPLVKLTIKKNTTVALFKMEDEYFKDIRKNAGSDGTKVKVKESEVVVGDMQALATAKEMIDLREDQIERYNEYLKEQRSMKRK